MKKSFVLLASVVALGGFVPSVLAEDNPNQKRIDEIETQIKELKSELKELKGDDEDDNEVVLDNELFKVSFVEAKEKDNELNVVFEVENKSDEEYIFQSEVLSIDGYMVDSGNFFMHDIISAGKKGKIRLEISDYNDEGLPELTGDLELTLRTIVNDDSVEVTKYPISVDLD